VTPEFSRPFRLDTIGGEPRRVAIEANEAERAALAARFGLQSVGSLGAEAVIRREGEQVWAEGALRAEAVQSCVATGDPVPAVVKERFALRFDPAGARAGEEELELDESDLDILTYDGGAIDLGEAVAQGFALALDPFPRAAGAEVALREAGVKSEEDAEEERIAASPFAALKGLKSD
jgi:uncharacterized metal-binding protein YceD (DUF177 family)